MNRYEQPFSELSESCSSASGNEFRRSGVTSRTVVAWRRTPIKIPAAPIMSADPDSLRPSEVPGGSQIAVRARRPRCHDQHGQYIWDRQQPLLKGSEQRGQRKRSQDTGHAAAIESGEIQYPRSEGYGECENGGGRAAFGQRGSEERNGTDQQGVKADVPAIRSRFRAYRGDRRGLPSISAESG